MNVSSVPPYALLREKIRTAHLLERIEKIRHSYIRFDICNENDYSLHIKIHM